jgi:hypothetical protein
MSEAVMEAVADAYEEVIHLWLIIKTRDS